ARDRGPRPLATANSTGKPELPHQPFNRASRHSSALSVQLPPDFTRAVDLDVLLPDPADLLSKDLLSLGPSGSKRRGTLLCFVRVVGGWSDRQHARDRLDSILLPVLVDEATITSVCGRAPPGRKKQQPSAGSRWPVGVHDSPARAP